MEKERNPRAELTLLGEKIDLSAMEVTSATAHVSEEELCRVLDEAYAERDHLMSQDWFRKDDPDLWTALYVLGRWLKAAVDQRYIRR